MKAIMVLLFLLPHSALAFKPLILHSGKTKLNLLELKVTDTCDACDPEEQWVADLRDQKTLWKKFVPVVEFPQENGKYPQFSLNGDDWTWTDGNQALPADSDALVGELHVARQRLQEFDVSFTPIDKLEKCNVTAHFLDQEFLSVGNATKELHKAGNSFASRILIPIPKGEMGKIKSVVFWVTDEDKKYIQAVGSNIKVE